MSAPASVFIAFARLHDCALPTPVDLPANITARLQGMRSDWARSHSAAGYSLLRHGAMLAGAEHIDLTTLGADANGRPRLQHGPDFNISHSRGLVACAIGLNCQVGLDVERIRERFNPRLRRMLTGDETSQTAPTLNFSDAWAAREATVKAGGRVGLARIARVQITGNTSRIDDETWQLRFPHLAEGYAVCLACEHTDITLECHDLSALLMKNSPA